MQTFGNFYLLSHSFEIWCDSLGEWKLATNAKFQLNFYKLMPARPKKKTTGTYAVKTTIAIIGHFHIKGGQSTFLALCQYILIIRICMTNF